MSGKKQIYKAWEQVDMCDEKGNRVIHFYLRSTSASPVLAAVGTEKRGHHYVYIVSKEFVETFGSSPAINARTKWTAREHVTDWLVSLVRNGNLSPTKPGTLCSLDRHNVPTQEGNVSLDLIARSEPSGVQLLEPKASQQEPFQVGDNIELLSQDDTSGCWYRCKIMEISKRFWKVQCYDMNDEKDIVPPRSAPTDELSMRHPFRLTIRPCPPQEEPPTFFEVGAAVDAWWKNGWWEGFVLTGVSLSNNDHYHVFFPGPRKFSVVHQEDLRVSREWVNDTWVPIKSQPDILSFIFSHIK